MARLGFTEHFFLVPPIFWLEVVRSNFESYDKFSEQSYPDKTCI